VTSLDDLRRTPNALAAHYSRFRVADRLLLTGHSHQAWPDIALEGQLRAFEDAAEAVDAKWERAFVMAERVRAGVRALLDDPTGQIALGANTHELVIRLLSALDLRRRPRLVTTDGEFHSLRRQLARLAEEGVELVRLPASPVDTLAARCASVIDDRTAAVLVSAVLFETARIVPGLGELAAACERRGVELLVDAYHALGVVPFSLPAMGLRAAWVIGGGYKYLQLGEGNCFMRLPAHSDRLRPVITGWFAEFDSIADDHRPGQVGYGRGAVRYAGSTYDPTSHYRAASVFDFFETHALAPALLRLVSQHQVGLLANGFDALDVPQEVVTRDRTAPLGDFAGFLALRSPHAVALRQALATRGVHTDARGSYLRLGPAPYLSDTQIEAAMAAFGTTIKEVLDR
jgi:kynureninase